MATEDDVYYWIKEQMRGCPGSEEISRDDIKKIYNGPMKEIFDSMCLRLRSNEYMEKIRQYEKRKFQNELLKRRSEAQEKIKQLEYKHLIFREQCSKLDLQTTSEPLKAELCLKVFSVQAKNSMLENQCQAVEELCKMGTFIEKKLPLTLMGNISQNVSYTFNPSQGKLETALKGELRMILKELSNKGVNDEVVRHILTVTHKYPGYERCTTLLELAREVTAAAQKLTKSIDLERHVKILSEELKNADHDSDIVQTLQRYIDDLTVEHAKLVVESRKSTAEVEQLDQQLSEMLAFAPHATNVARNAMLQTQITQLRKSIRQLTLQDNQEHECHFEQATMIDKIKTFNEDMLCRKKEIVNLIGIMKNTIDQAWQSLRETLNRTQEAETKFEAIDDLNKLQKEQYKILTEYTPGTLTRMQQMQMLPQLSISSLRQSFALKLIETKRRNQLMLLNFKYLKKQEDRQKHNLAFVKILIKTMSFAKAGRAEILRAAQKDNEFCDQLKIVFSDFIAEIAGQRLWITRYNILGNFTRFLYQSCTTMRNLQTLGEEYTSIVQVDSTGRHVPMKSMLACCVLLDSGGELMLKWLLLQCEKCLRQKRFNPDTHNKMQNLLLVWKALVPFLQHLHKTVFYLNGRYYSFSKRCMGIHYVLFRAWLKDTESQKTFHWLGVVSAAYLLLTTLHSLRSQHFWNKDDKILSTAQPLQNSYCKDPKLRCSLCLELRTDTSCTPCGHLFCWSCIHEWLLSKHECPLCRDQVQPSRVIRLQNYEVSQTSPANLL